MKSSESGRGQVLIVEDDEEMARLIELWLEDTHAIELVHSCEAAYDRLDESVDVALLDRNLPDGTGDDVLAHVRESEYSCRVAMVTAVDPGLGIVEMGFDDYLTKPTTRDELLDLVRRLLVQREYSAGVQRLYRLIRKRALLEQHHPQGHLETNQEYQELVAEIEALDEKLSQQGQDISDCQFLAELQHL